MYTIKHTMQNKLTYLIIINVLKKKATGTNTAAGSRSMKRNLDTGVEVCDKKLKL